MIFEQSFGHSKFETSGNMTSISAKIFIPVENICKNIVTQADYLLWMCCKD